MAKYLIVDSSIAYIVKNDNDTILTFNCGKYLTCPSFTPPKNFIQFTDKVFINPEFILYVKNNIIEKDKKSLPKLTIVLSNTEFYRKFKSEEELLKYWKYLSKILKKG